MDTTEQGGGGREDGLEKAEVSGVAAAAIDAARKLATSREASKKVNSPPWTSLAFGYGGDCQQLCTAQM